MIKRTMTWLALAGGAAFLGLVFCGPVTAGQKEGTEGSWVELGPGVQWVQIDLEKEATIYGILLWHQHADPRVYRDVIVQISNDPEFKKDVVTVFNNDQDNSAGLGAG